MIGRKIEQYTILEKLGSGGMGSVYKAHDSKLSRFVALKFLHLDLNADSDSIRRFRREARTASSLDHPNICTVYDISQTSDGQSYIAMAYYEGETLDQKIEQGSLSVGGALHIAIQVGEGLRAAHAAGVVHRDIKPANVMVTHDGTVKILDFGLAKAAGSLITREGSTIGTTAYMSPEQLQGEEVNQQTDIWSFGVLLYELLSGKRPFDAAYPQAIMYAILNQDPPPLDVHSSDFRAALSPVLKKLLAKNTEQRYRTLDIVLTDLMLIVKGISDRTLGGKSPSLISSSVRIIAFLVLIVFVASIAGAFLFSRFFDGPSADGIRLDPEVAKRLTYSSGFAEHPVFSPDGKTVAYSNYIDEGIQIWAQSTTGLQLTQLTTGPDWSSGPAWSPDSSKLAFSKRGNGISIMAPNGGPSQALTPFGKHPTWSPRGDKIAFDDNGTIYSVSGTPRLSPEEPAVLAEGIGSSNPYTIWSPDGQSIVFWHRVAGDVYVKNIDTNDSHSLGIVPTGQEIGGLTLTRNGELFFSRGSYGGEQSLWVVWIDLETLNTTSESERVSPAGTDISGCVTALNAMQLACMFRDIKRELISVPLSPETGLPRTDLGPETVSFASRAEYPAFSLDGQRLVWTSHEMGSGHLFIRDITGSKHDKVTSANNPGLRETAASFAPNGRLFFASTSSDQYTLSVVQDVGMAVIPVISAPSGIKDLAPAHSPTRDELAFYSNRSGTFDIWTVPTDQNDAEPVQLTFGTGSDIYPTWDATGNRIAYVSDSLGTPDIWIMDRNGGNKAVLYEGSGEEAWPTWHPDQNWLYFASSDEGVFNVYKLDMDSGGVQIVTEYFSPVVGLPERALFTKFTVSSDRLVAPIETRKSQIVVLDIVRE